MTEQLTTGENAVPAPICHVNLSPYFRGGERQAEILIRGVSGWGVRQRFVGNENGQLVANLEGVKDLEIVATSARSKAVSAILGSSCSENSMGELIAPGATAFTVMPLGASSKAMDVSAG